MVAAAITLLLIISPFGEAASVHRITSYGPPFVGMTTNATMKQTFGCGVSGSITKQPAFVLPTGVEVLGQKTKAVSCPSPLGYNWVSTSGSGAYWTNKFNGTAGLHHIVAHWKVSFSFTITAHNGPTHKGAARSTVFLAAILYLLDETNLTYIGPANSWGAFYAVTNGTLSASPTATVTMFINQTLIAGHVYVITTAIYATAYSWASSAGPSSATAVLNLGGPGGNTHLTSVTRT